MLPHNWKHVSVLILSHFSSLLISLSEKLQLQSHFPKCVMVRKYTVAAEPTPGKVERGEAVWKSTKTWERPH